MRDVEAGPARSIHESPNISPPWARTGKRDFGPWARHDLHELMGSIRLLRTAGGDADATFSGKSKALAGPGQACFIWRVVETRPTCKA